MTPVWFARAAVAAPLLAGLILAGGGIRPALAHANLESSTPAANSVVTDPPAEVTLKFTEPVEGSLTEIRVLDTTGVRVDQGVTSVSTSDATVATVGVGTLGDGTYTVSWRNVSAVDGHPVVGSFTFSVGFPTVTTIPKAERPPLLTSPAEPLVRWAAFIGVLGLAGGLLLRFVFDLTAARSITPSASGPDYDFNPVRRRSDIALWSLLALAVAGSIVHGAVVAAGTYQTGLGSVVSGDLVRLVSDTSWGRIWLARVALLASAAIPLAIFTASGNRPLPGNARRSRGGAPPLLVAIVLSAGAAATFSISSHGAAIGGIGGIALASDLLHVFASAVWVGGLVQLAVMVPSLVRSGSEDVRSRLLPSLVPQFSLLAGLSAGVLLVTGIFSGYVQVTRLDAAWTPYGIALIAKILVIAPLVGLAALNLLWVRPRLRSHATSRKWLVRFVSAEVAFAALVLLAAGFLTSMEPARQARSRELASAPGVDFADRADSARIVASLQPGTVGDNSIVVHLEDRAGWPIENATSVSGRMRYLGQDLGESFTAGLDHGDGIWVIHSVPVPIAGAWQLEVLVQRPDAFDANLAWRLDVATTAARRSALRPDPGTARLLFGLQIALIGLLFAGAALPVGGWWSARGRVLSVTGWGAVIVGAAFILRSGAFGESGQAIANPVPASESSIDQGRALYVQNCQTCHGESGRGNGPSRGGLPAAPADLTLHVPLHGDGVLFGFIHDGLNTMPAWGDQLSDEEIWHLVNYMRTFTTTVEQ